jgi:hypothetical protein
MILCLKKMAGKKQHQFGEEKIRNQNEHGCGDHSLRGRPANALRSTRHIQTLVAPDGR